MPKKNINQIGIYYEIYGDGEPLLFIHGLGSSRVGWEKQVPFFSRRFQVITLDLRGHGKSDKPKRPYSINIFAEDIAKLLRALKITHLHVVGLSLGGCIAFQFAIDFPQMIKSLVIVNSGPGTFKFPFKSKVEYFKRKIIVRLYGMKKMGKILAPRLFIKPEQEELRQKLIKRWAENDKNAYVKSLYTLKGWCVRDQLQKIKNSTLIIGSDGDYSPISYKEQYAKLIPNTKLVEVRDARHYLPQEKPREFNDALMEFLSTQI